MEIIGAALGNGVDDGSRRASILGGIVGGENGKFLDSIDPQI